jgi:hypothetical protein
MTPIVALIRFGGMPAPVHAPPIEEFDEVTNG